MGKEGFEMFGYSGKVLDVDLSAGDIGTRMLEEEDCRLFLGGAGFAANIYLDMFPGDVDPLSPENPLILMTGPVTGSGVFGGNRFAVAARSPLTGYWGEASCGGYFGVELKTAGYDGIIFRGASPRPVYLWIHGDKVELRDASDLWGMDTYETTDFLKERGKSESGRIPRVIAIGIAGELGVKFASIIHDKGHVAGRTGMGAVMGSKNLKAVSVAGVGNKVEIADPQTLKSWREKVREIYSESIITDSLKAFGTNSSLEIGSMLGDVPFRNWQVGSWDEGVEKLSGPTYSDEILVKTHACWGCPVGCKRIVRVEEPYVVPEGAGPEYETVCMFGTNLLNDDLRSVAKANEMCNRYGMDTITMGETIALVTECQEKGLFSPQDCDGISIAWGDPNNMLRLIDSTARREGFGARMAEGTRKLARSIGVEASGMAIEVRGLELPAHDPRGFHGFAMAYATSVRGACHCASMNLYIEQGSAAPLPKIGLEGPFEEQSSEGKAFLTARAQELGQMYNSAIICILAAVPWDEDLILGAVNSVTGFGYDLDDLMRVGERAWYLKRGLQFLFGSTAQEDQVPPRILEPVEEGPHAGSVPDFELMKREFYELRELGEDGLPTREKLDKLGLSYLAGKLDTPFHK